MTGGSDRDEIRREVAARGLTPTAVAHLTHGALSRIEFTNLAPVKGLLKQFFSDQAWTDVDDASLADLVGPGRGWWSHALDQDFGVEFGWRDGAFRLDLSRRIPFDETFNGTVVPEATPNPRTIRFVTGPIHDGPSRWYASADGVDDHRVSELFAPFDDVVNVLVGPDFVAVGIRHPERWEELLAPILRAVTTQFTSTSPAPRPAANDTRDITTQSERGKAATRRSTDRGGSLERAWRELGRLQADRTDDLRRILDAVESSDVATRQVAARLLVGADVDVAAAAWSGLLDDSSRAVRRATVDAMVDTDRQALRPLIEAALNDSDAWARWKALRGLVTLGAEPSRAVIAPLAEDPDFRVRLEATAALRPDRA